MNVYREKYYEKSFKNLNDDKIIDMVSAYIKTMMWNYIYYTRGPSEVDTTWMYPYYYSPLLVDLALNATNIKDKNVKRYPGMIKYNALHQLVTVLPSQSINIVPDELRSLFTNTSPIYDLFPITFVNDKEGHVQKKIVGKPVIDYGIAIIPIPDQQRIIDIVNTLTFTTNRLKLWEESTPLIIGKSFVPKLRANAPTFTPKFNVNAPTFTPKPVNVPITTFKPVPMINLTNIVNYIKTGQLPKTVKEELFEMSWY
jgi:5''-3'' exonuclease